MLPKELVELLGFLGELGFSARQEVFSDQILLLKLLKREPNYGIVNTRYKVNAFVPWKFYLFSFVLPLNSIFIKI